MSIDSNRPSPPPLSLTVFDVVGLASAGFGLLLAVFVMVWVRPTLLKMLTDFGGPTLPVYSELCLQPWFPLVMSLVPLGATCLGIFRQASRRVRAWLMGLSIFLTLALLGTLLAGVSVLPLFHFHHGGEIK